MTRVRCERRRFRRADVEAPVTLQVIAPAGGEPVTLTGQAKNVSLAGLLCYVKAPCLLTPGQPVTSSLSVSEEQVRLFPFARLLGRGWVTRVEPIAVGKRAGEPSSNDESLVSVTIAFTPDLTALGMLESS